MAEPVYDVAIVGYGPVGAVLAALLGQAGLTVHVCDRLPGVYEIPRAIALDHEILRVFQQIGFVEPVELCESLRSKPMQPLRASVVLRA